MVIRPLLGPPGLTNFTKPQTRTLQVLGGLGGAGAPPSAGATPGAEVVGTGDTVKYVGSGVQVLEFTVGFRLKLLGGGVSAEFSVWV